MSKIGGEFYFNTKSAEGSKKITTTRNTTIMVYTPGQHNDAGEVTTRDRKPSQAVRVTDGGEARYDRQELSMGDADGSSIFNTITKLDNNGNDLTTIDLSKVTQEWLRKTFGRTVKLLSKFNQSTGSVEIEYTTNSGNTKRLYINVQMDGEDDEKQAEQVRNKKSSNAKAIAKKCETNLKQKLQEKLGDKYTVAVETNANPYEAPKMCQITLNQNTTLGQVRSDLGLPEKVIKNANPQLDLKAMSGVSDFEVSWLHKDRNYDKIEISAGTVINVPYRTINL